MAKWESNSIELMRNYRNGTAQKKNNNNIKTMTQNDNKNGDTKISIVLPLRGVLDAFYLIEIEVTEFVYGVKLMRIIFMH